MQLALKNSGMCSDLNPFCVVDEFLKTLKSVDSTRLCRLTLLLFSVYAPSSGGKGEQRGFI